EYRRQDCLAVQPQPEAPPPSRRPRQPVLLPCRVVPVQLPGSGARCLSVRSSCDDAGALCTGRYSRGFATIGSMATKIVVGGWSSFTWRCTHRETDAQVIHTILDMLRGEDGVGQEQVQLPRRAVIRAARASRL